MADVQPLTEQEQAELVAFLDGELDADAARQMETRLSVDSRFRTEAATLQRTWALLDVLPKPEPSAAFASRTLDKIAALPASPSVARSRSIPVPAIRWFAWAAALLAAAGIGYALTPPARFEVNLDTDSVYKTEPRLIDNLPLYLAVDNLEFLQLLDTPDLFGDDSMGR